MHEIEARGTILEPLAHGAYRAELANGHRCVARPVKGTGETFAPGDTVRLSFSPADLSRARIIARWDDRAPRLSPSPQSGSDRGH